MTGPKNGRSRTFSVTMSTDTAESIKLFHKQAIDRGEGREFLAAFQAIEQRLRTDPLVFGESLYRLPALELIVCQAVISPLLVDYAVHKERHLVFIKGFKILKKR